MAKPTKDIKVNTKTEAVTDEDRTEAAPRTPTAIKKPLASNTPNPDVKVVTETKVVDFTKAPAKPKRKAPKAETTEVPGRATEVRFI